MGSAYGAGAGAEQLQSIIARHAIEAYRNRELALREREADERLAVQRENLERQRGNDAYLQEQRGALADLRRQQQADRLAGNLPVGGSVDATARDTLQAGGLGSLVQHQDATLGSRNLSGVLGSDGTPGAPLRLKGRIVSTDNPGAAARDEYLGTAAQQQAAQQTAKVQELIDDPDTPDQVRRYLQIQHASGSHGSLPSALFADPAEKAQRDLDLFKAKRDYTTAHPMPARASTSTRLAPGQDDPALPRGAQAYIASIAAKHGGADWDGARGELVDYLAQQQDHPGLSADRAMKALQTAMRRPTGTRSGYAAPGGGPATVLDPPASTSPARMAAIDGRPTRAAATAARPGFVKMRAPDGTVRDIPQDEVEHFVSRGATVVR
jgi:hypothetical protein